MRRLWLLLFLCLAAWPVEAAERVLALTPHACEMVYAIGAEERLVGAGSYCDYPAEAERLPRVGSHERINVEAALRLKPDLIIVMSRNVAGVATLEKMGVEVAVSSPTSFEALFSDMLKLGELTDHSEQAKAVVTQLQARLQKVRAMPRSGRAVFYEIWPDPIMTAGGSSFITQLIEEAGGRNVFAGIDLPAPHVSVEAVIRAKPQLIVVPLEGRDIRARQQFWRKWLGPDVRMVAIDPDILHRPGPRLLDGLETLQRAISDEALQ
jgi:ABC-type Fe3+-hydroxamate transport system substrate-binding protein